MVSITFYEGYDEDKEYGDYYDYDYEDYDEEDYTENEEDYGKEVYSQNSIIRSLRLGVQALIF